MVKTILNTYIVQLKCSFRNFIIAFFQKLFMEENSHEHCNPDFYNVIESLADDLDVIESSRGECAQVIYDYIYTCIY